MNEQKLCESAYLTSPNPEQGPFIHGAAMIDRTSGTTHLYLVRGRNSDSVVGELHRQLVRNGRLPRQGFRRGATLPGLLFFVTVGAVMTAAAALLGVSR